MEELANLVKTQDDPEIGLGLCAIRDITKKAEYQLTLGLNVFTMTVLLKYLKSNGATGNTG